MPPQQQALNLPCVSRSTHQNTLGVRTNTYQNALGVSTGTRQSILGRVQQTHVFAALGNSSPLCRGTMSPRTDAREGKCLSSCK